MAFICGGPAYGSGESVALGKLESVLSTSGPIVTFVSEGGAVIAILPTPEQPPRFRHLDVIRILEENGYIILSVRETLLNRIRIQARNEIHLREIVISRSSGNILRDVALETYRGRIDR